MKYWRRLWPYLQPDAWRFGIALALMPVITALGLLQPYLLKETMDAHIVVGQSEGLMPLVFGYLAVVLGGFVASALYSIQLATGTESSILRLRDALFRQIMSLSQRFFERQPTGQILSRATSDVDALSEALTAGSLTLVLDILNMGGVIVAMFLLNWKMTLVLLTIGPPLGLMIDFFRRQMRVLFAEVRDALAALNTYLAERIAGVEIIQLYQQEGHMGDRFAALDARHRDANVKNNWYDASLYALIDGIASITVAMMMGFGAWMVAGGEAGVTVGTIVAFVDYIDRLFRPLRELSTKITFLQRAETALDKIFWLLSVDDRITPGTQTLPAPQGRLSLQDVRFRYRPDGPDVLDGISLEIAPGEVVAVVGRTGSGKSTLVRLLGRVHDGYQGRILVDGVELSDIAPGSVRRAVGMVRQEVQLFSDTLRFNITLGDPSLDPARIEDAILLSNANVVAATRSAGLEHVVRDRGADISAGQAQIIALARTLARDPAIVILDEATASVDPVTEQLLQEAVNRIFERKTCLVIAHRLSTITGADRIVVMDKGRIIEQGTHAELIKQGGAYASLYAEGFGEEP